MELFEILNNILRTKNKIRDILGENNNIARYYVSIHNFLLDKYNAGYRVGFHDRWYQLTHEDRYVVSEIEPLNYNITAKYYEEYTPDVLTDIMRDVLNYRLNMKDELNFYLEPDVDDHFVTYPDYLLNLLGDEEQGLQSQAYQLGYEMGITNADTAYNGASEVHMPTITNNANRITLSSDQDEALIVFKLGLNGVETIYTGPFILSEDVDIYYEAKIGLLTTGWSEPYQFTYAQGGNVAFVSPPLIWQEKDVIYMSCPTNNATIQYSIDGGQWYTYTGNIMVLPEMNMIKAVAVRNNEYSKYNSLEIKEYAEIDPLAPANVRCTITDNGSNRTVTLSCETANATIKYAIDEDTGFYHTYSAPFTVESNHFVIYTFSEYTDGSGTKHQSMKLLYKWDPIDEYNVPADVQFMPEGSTVTLYTVTNGAKVNYRLGPSGNYTVSESNAVSLSPSTQTDIYAYATLNGTKSRNETRYTFTPQGYIAAPPKPTFSRQGNTIFIISDNEVRYNLSQKDPESYGTVYNPSIGINITEYTIIYAKAVKGNVYSALATGSFNYDDSSTGGPSGSTGGVNPTDPTGPTNGTVTDEPFSGTEWFAVTGVSSVTFTGTELLFASAGDTYWRKANAGLITGLDTNRTYYMKGQVSKFVSFAGSATISGEISSVISGEIGTPDCMLTNMFNGCNGLVNASGLKITINNMPERMMYQMFRGCNDLRDASFTINAANISVQGMGSMFYGCSQLLGIPAMNFSSVAPSGLQDAFNGCSSIESIGTLSLTSVGESAFYGCFKDCRRLNTVNMSTPSGAAPNNAYNQMFSGCSMLSDISGVHLNHNAVGQNSYYRMFYDTTSLKLRANEFILPAETLANQCYSEMFMNSGIDNPPKIMSSTVAPYCFSSMFENCQYLQQAPELDAKYLNGSNGCYNRMFYGCSHLNYIKALFLTTPASGIYTANWVAGVALDGTFEINKEAAALWASPSNTNRFGPNAIPVDAERPWTVIGVSATASVVIEEENGMGKITSTSNDEIWYIDSQVAIPNCTSDMLTKKYEGKFELRWNPTYVYAAAKNEDGIFGQIAYKALTPGWPPLVITPQGNRIYITNPHEFTYDSIWYELKSYDETTQIQSTTSYTLGTPITITDSVTVIAYGYVGNTLAVTTKLNHVFGLNPPTITVYVGHVDSDNPLYYVGLSYPGEYVSMYWKLNDNEQDNPDTSTAWRLYSGNSFRLNDYFTNDRTEYVVSAIAKVNYQGNEVWSPITSTNIGTSTSAILSDPQLIQLPNSNTIRLVYENQEYPQWDPSPTGMDIEIEYKIGQGGAVQQYLGDFNLTGVVDNPNVYIYVRAKRGNFWTTTNWDVYGGTPFGPFNFSLEHLHFDLDETMISESWDDTNHEMTIYVTNTTWSDGAFPVYNYIWIEPISYDATGFRPSESDDVYWGWMPITPAGQKVNKHIVRFIVHAYTRKNNDTYPADWPNSDVTKEYNISDWWEWDNRPMPSINISADMTVTITCPFDVEPFVKVVTDGNSWGTGTVDEHKYDNYKYATAYGLGKIGTGKYAGKLDEHLAKGTIYAYYQYEGLDSGEREQEYTNSSVQPLTAPLIICDWNPQKKAYILKISNDVNPGVILRYKIIDGTTPLKWGGGVIDEHKYDNWKVCSIYGDTLSEYLISGTIVAQTLYDPHGSNQTRESTQPFINEHYDTLKPPQIFLVKKTNGYAIKVTNNNKLATNYFRLKNDPDNTEWAPNATNTHIYDNWQTAFGTDNDISTYLWRGIFEAYSVYGSENTLYELTELSYDTGETLDDDPPTISTVTDTNAEITTVSIVNEASVGQGFSNILWKIDEIEWNNEDGVSCFYTKYQSDTNGQWKFVNNPLNATYTFTIGKDVASGYIMAFASGGTNSVNYERFERTPVTTYWFVNPLLQS